MAAARQSRGRSSNTSTLLYTTRFLFVPHHALPAQCPPNPPADARALRDVADCFFSHGYLSCRHELGLEHSAGGSILARMSPRLAHFSFQTILTFPVYATRTFQRVLALLQARGDPTLAQTLASPRHHQCPTPLPQQFMPTIHNEPRYNVPLISPVIYFTCILL
ncbi:hypothetical protein C8R47DRAFT_199421 [Mycena vitilis]|nr:hypothetical protein C8R47DRAFT_199421 [Mycena vitilis]